MKRVKRDGGVRGVAWQMGGPPASRIPQLIIAVAGETVVLRHDDGMWRSGLYMNEEEAGKYATIMTEKREREGLKLTAGPAEFMVDHDNPDADTLHFAILAALKL